jgi:hypothetical protein
MRRTLFLACLRCEQFPWPNPSSGASDQIESCFLLMDPKLYS